MLSPASPQFLVDDLQASIRYYVDVLGFETNIEHQDFYASVVRDQAEIHLKAAPKTAEERKLRLENQHLDAYIWVNAFDELYDEFQSSGAIILYAPQQQPWGVYDFYVKDIDDYILCFGKHAPND